MTYEQFIEEYGQELGECLFMCDMINGDGSVVLKAEDLAPVVQEREISLFHDYSW